MQNCQVSRIKVPRMFRKVVKVHQVKSPENFAVCFHTTSCGLAEGGGIGETRTRAKDAVACSVSDEPHPRLRETARCLLAFFFDYFTFQHQHQPKCLFLPVLFPKSLDLFSLYKFCEKDRLENKIYQFLNNSQLQKLQESLPPLQD